MFQREWTQKQQLTPEEWKKEVGSCAAAWHQLDDDEKERFEAAAQLEQFQREEAMLQPHQSKSDEARGERRLGKATFDAAAGLSKAALLKCSKARLQATYSEFQDSTSWSTWNGGIASSEGCLKLDNIDLNTTADDIAERWSKGFDNPVASDKLWQQESVEGCKHDVCQGWFGTCSKLPHVKLAVSFVLAMHKLLSAGFLVKQFLIVMFTCFYTCYYVDNFFSISHTIVLKFTFCCS
jgi:hypothetical protein